MFSNSSISFEGDESDPSFIYYDITVTSTRTEETGITDPQVRFQESRTQPIVSDCSKYNMAIIRFTMDGAGSDLPLWIPTIMPDSDQQNLRGYDGQGYTGFDPNMTIYAVTLNVFKNGINASGTTYIEWVSEINNAAVGSPKYYYTYSYSHFCSLFNKAVLNAFTICVSQVVNPLSKPPKLVYNGATNLFSLYCDSLGYGDDRTLTTESWTITFDANLYQLLRNFENIYTPNNQPSTNEIIVRNNINNIFTGLDGTKYYVMTQDFPSTDTMWSPVQSILFTSSLLPIIPEQLGTPIIFSNNNNTNPITSQANFQQTITDIALPMYRSSDYKGFVEFAPNPYRLISLSPSKQEIRQLDVSVFWKDRSGVLTPMTLANGATVSLKIMFRKRTLGV